MKRLALAFLGLALVAPAAGAQLLPLDFVDQMVLAPIDNDALLARDAADAGPGVAPRYAEPVDVNVRPGAAGTWENTLDGTAIWRYRVSSPGALSLSFGFTRYTMPQGGSLSVYAPGQEPAFRSFTAEDNEVHGQLWTPILKGDEAVIEVRVPATGADELDLRLGRVLHGYAPFGYPGGLRAPESGACNVDVICPEGDDWRPEIRSVAVIGTGGGTFCTGFMVNNTAQDLTPYFMTAFHCGIGAGQAPSLVVYWNYENSTCRTPGSPASGGPGDGSLAQFQTGSVLRAAYGPSDVTLVELDDDPESAWNVHWAGWDATSGDFPGAIAIHHPSTDEKRISFENQPTTTTSYLSAAVPGDGTHVRVEDWDVGTTEGGSSGSPLFNPDKRVVGQLHGGFAACGNDDADWYGRMSISWDGGGSAATRLRDWLDPGNTGALTLDGRDQAPDFALAVQPATADICTGDDGVFTVDVLSTLGFSDPVTLTAAGQPAGATTAFDVNPVTPAGQSQLTIGNTGGAAVGDYTVTVTGTAAGPLVHTADALLRVFSGNPAAVTLTAPADAAVGQAIDVQFQWQAAGNTGSYDLQIATDAGFASVVDDATGIAGTQYVSTALAGSSTYYWRVRAVNGCGEGSWSATRSFTTEVLPGDCPAGQSGFEVWFDDLESGAGGWTTGGTAPTWALDGGNVHSGANAYHADNVASVSDQHLVTPSIALPTGASPVTLQFWNNQQLESSTGGCFDGGVLEISTDGGATWTRLESELLTDPYDGAISNQYSNPLADENAWCGDPQAWMNSIVDLDAWAGQTVQLRFRLATDSSVARPGWTIDDVRVRGCGASDIFTDGFESADLLAWSNVVVD
ncbi:MAG: choice-of-anchor J domain-containing protein [Acidobacteriota bacterium]